MIQTAAFTFNPFGENTYVVYDNTLEAVIVDPGNYGREEDDELFDFIASKGLKPVLIANTHAHIDHVLGVAAVKSRFGIDFALHREEYPLLRAVKTYAPNYGFPAFDEPEVGQWLEPGVPLHFGNSVLDIIFVPGHAPGHVAFYHRPQQLLWGGDVLFRESIGRTDLPGGDFATLIRSIRSELFTLGDEVTVFPGHGPSTTIGHEKRHNPFLNT